MRFEVHIYYTTVQLDVQVPLKTLKFQQLFLTGSHEVTGSSPVFSTNEKCWNFNDSNTF